MALVSQYMECTYICRSVNRMYAYVQRRSRNLTDFIVDDKHPYYKVPRDDKTVLTLL